jgi:hypothetical protein
VVANSSAHSSVKQSPWQGHLAIVAREIFVDTYPVAISPRCCARGRGGVGNFISSEEDDFFRACLMHPTKV